MKTCTMKCISRTLAVCSLVLIGSAQAADTLTGEQIKQLLSDTELSCRGRYKTSIEYTADGKMLGFVPGHGYSDDGKWWVAEDKYCRKWRKWRKGQKNCLAVSRSSDEVYFHRENGDRVPCKIKE